MKFGSDSFQQDRSKYCFPFIDLFQFMNLVLKLYNLLYTYSDDLHTFLVLTRLLFAVFHVSICLSVKFINFDPVDTFHISFTINHFLNNMKMLHFTKIYIKSIVWLNFVQCWLHCMSPNTVQWNFPILTQSAISMYLLQTVTNLWLDKVKLDFYPHATFW